MLTERVMAAGDFSVTITAASRDKREHNPYAWMFVTPARIVDPSVTVANLKAFSCFTGWVIGRERLGGGAVEYSGWTIQALIETPNETGPASNSVSETSLATLWSSAELFDPANERMNGLTQHTVDGAAGTFTIPNGTLTRGGLMETLANNDLETYEYSISPNGEAQLRDIAPTSPRCLIWRGPQMLSMQSVLGVPLDKMVLHAEDLSQLTDHEDYVTGARFTRSGGTVTSTNRSHSYVGFDGSTTLHIEVTETDDSVTSSAEATGRNRALILENTENNAISLEVTSRPDLRSNSGAASGLRPGENVYVYDLETETYDATNEIYWPGFPVNPASYRLLGYTRPLQAGMGVYMVNNAQTSIVDVSDFVEYETGSTTLELGERVRPRTLQQLVKNRGGWN